MRLMKYLPFAFFSGIHGFALFAPYAAVVVALDLTVKRVRRDKAVSSDVADESMDVLEATSL